MFEKRFSFIALLLNHKAPGHINTLLTTAGFLLPSPMQEKTHEFMIILVYVSLLHAPLLKSVLYCPDPLEGYIWFPSTAFHLSIFFSLVLCLYWKGSQESYFPTVPNKFSLFLNSLKQPGEKKREDNPSLVVTHQGLRCCETYSRDGRSKC